MINPVEIINFSVIEPAISAKAFEIHYKQHYRQYVNKLNVLIEDTIFDSLSVEQIINNSETGGEIYNNATQVWNHERFFEQFTGQSHWYFRGSVYKKYSVYIPSIPNLLAEASSKLFGSGYIWLVAAYNTSTQRFNVLVQCFKNSQTPIEDETLIPLICMDMWEHSYYLDYQSYKVDYIENLFDKIDWSVIANRIPK